MERQSGRVEEGEHMARAVVEEEECWGKWGDTVGEGRERGIDRGREDSDT